MFFKLCEKFLNEKLIPFVNRSISELMPAYRSGYSANHVLIPLIENWRRALDNNFLTAAVLMDLSKAFDGIPHNLLIAKLHASGLDFATVTFLRRKQIVSIESKL